MKIRSPIVAALVIASACSDRVVEPSGSAESVAVNQEVTGTLGPGQVHVFVVWGRAGDVRRVRFQADVTGDQDVLHLEVTDFLNATRLASVTAGREMTAFPESQSGWFRYSRDEPYLIRVSGAGAEARGSYTFEVVGLEREIAYGDTVAGGAFMDLQTFSFDAMAGDELIFFLQSVPTRLPRHGDERLFLEVAREDVVERRVHQDAAGPTGHLESRSTGRFELPATERYAVRIGGWGDFRFMIQPVDRRPSTRAQQVNVGDVIAGESIDHVGDVDEYRFAGQLGQELTAQVRRVGGLAAGFVFEVIGPGGEALTRLPHPPVPMVDTMYSPRFALPATGGYTIRVSGHDAGVPAEVTGTYELELLAVDRNPRNVSGHVRTSAWILGETIDFPGDIDEYVFTVEEDGLYVVALARDGPGPESHLELAIQSPDGATVDGLQIDAMTAHEIQHTTRLPLLPGDHLILVESPHWPPRPGGYRFRAYQVRAEPETAAAMIQVGVLVTGEAIDEPGDIDTFTFHGTEDTELIVFARQISAGGSPFLAAFHWGHHAGQLDVAHAADIFGGGAAGAFALPHTGTHSITVEGWDVPGAYELLLFPRDREPETRPARIEPGAWVTGESIFPRGDVDEFVIHLTAGDSIRLEARYLDAVGDDQLQITVRGPHGEWLSAGILFGAVAWSGPKAGVAATGDHVVTVESIVTSGTLIQGEYEFIVHRFGSPGS